MVWYSHLSKSFLQFVTVRTVKGFSVVNETETDIFLKFPCFLYNTVNVDNLISSSSSFSKPSLDIWKFLVRITLNVRSSPVAYWTTSDLGDLSFGVIFFGLLYSSWGSHSKYTGVVCHPLLQWITFCQNSLLWSVCLGWPRTAWLIASLSSQAPSSWQGSDPWRGQARVLKPQIKTYWPSWSLLATIQIFSFLFLYLINKKSGWCYWPLSFTLPSLYSHLSSVQSGFCSTSLLTPLWLKLLVTCWVQNPNEHIPALILSGLLICI